MTSPIVCCTHETISDDLIRARAAHANRMLAEELPEDPPLIIEDSVKRMRTLPPIVRLHMWLLWHEDRIAAEACLNWAELDSNRQSSHVSISVEPDLRRRGIGAQLLALALAKAQAIGRPQLMASSSGRIPAGAEFLDRFGFARGLEAHLNQLDLARLDTALLARWRADGRERGTDYALELWDGAVPEASLAAFAGLSNVMNGEPRGSLDVEDVEVTPEMIRDGDTFILANGTRRLITCARHLPTGMLAGFTELSWNPKRTAIVWQHGTGVLVPHRGKRLGRYLKAVNMEAMLAANPAARFVRTGNADSNAPMLAINRQMGFEPFIGETVWQAGASVVAARLAERSRNAGDATRRRVA
jgi:GNAT superfamily N-acetyltransferase